MIALNVLESGRVIVAGSYTADVKGGWVGWRGPWNVTRRHVRTGESDERGHYDPLCHFHRRRQADGAMRQADRRMTITTATTQPATGGRRGDLLRLATAGSVDDGKSTLIGRLLYDSKALMSDQLAEAEVDLAL